MTKTLDRNVRPLPNIDPEVSRNVGDYFRKEWKGKKRIGRTASSYRKEAYDCLAALAEYELALKNSRGEYQRGGLEDLSANALKAAREAERMAELYEQTEHYFAPFRWLVRLIKGSHLFGFFIFSILLSDPLITASAIGNSGELNSILGITFFFLGIVGCYLFFWKKHLMNRARDKY